MPRTDPRVLTRDAAVALGLSSSAIDRRLASGQWRRILPRTYATVDHLTERDRADAALLYAGEGAALSSAYALRASGVRGVVDPGSALVLVPPTNRIEARSWVRIRRTFRPIEIEQWSGPRRVVPARSAADLALELRTIDNVRSLVARIVGDGHARLDDLVAELDAGPRQSSGLLRQALAEVGAGAASAPEARAARALRRAGLRAFEQNARIELPGGGAYVADFLWRELRAILEIDSVEYHLGPAQWRATMTDTSRWPPWVTRSSIGRRLRCTTSPVSCVRSPPGSTLWPALCDQDGGSPGLPMPTPT